MTDDPAQFKGEGPGLFDQASGKPLGTPESVTRRCVPCDMDVPHAYGKTLHIKMPNPVDTTIVLSFPGIGPYCLQCCERLVQMIAIAIEPRIQEKVRGIETSVVTKLRNDAEHWRKLYEELKAHRGEDYANHS